MNTLPRDKTSRLAHRPLDWGVLVVGVLAVSTASVLIRLTPAPALAIGAWRMLLAAILLTPFALPRLRAEWPTLGRREVLCLALAGLALAAHFAAWITSLAYTTVASSVILVTTNPIYVGLAGHFILHERVGGRKALAIAIALAGSVVVSYGDLRISGQALLGDALALLGALMMSSYMLLGRVVRRKLSTLAYIWPCYSLAAVFLLLICLLTRQPLLGYAPPTYLLFGLMALVPQILGHSAFNWALAHFSAVFVTLALLGEPIGASLLAWLTLHEAPPVTAVLGGLLILGGIYLASREEIAGL